VNAKVLVTGADGFIGSHLTEALVRDGHDVRAFVLYNSFNSWGWRDTCAADVKGRFEVFAGDIRDPNGVRTAMKDCDAVLHLAALIAIPYSYHSPDTYVDTNIKGTLNVLEGSRRSGCRRVIQTSTSEVYGTPDILPFLETHPLQGQSPYSASKIGADKLCEAYHLSFGVPVVTIRPFNTYGPRQSTRAVLPTMLVQLLAGANEVRLGRLDPKRDLTFVSDTVDGFIRAGEAPDVEGEVIQLGTGRTVSVGELFEAACVALGVQARAVQDPERLRPSGSEVMVLLSDPAKAKRLLQWEARVCLEDGLAQTATWIGKHLHLYDPERYHL
jgi:dTDP-glucose 4,6-dehydratase